MNKVKIFWSAMSRSLGAGVICLFLGIVAAFYLDGEATVRMAVQNGWTGVALFMAGMLAADLYDATENRPKLAIMLQTLGTVVLVCAIALRILGVIDVSSMGNG